MDDLISRQEFRMTREEAKEILQGSRITSFRPNGTARAKEALNMAIEALSAETRPTGEWIDIDNYYSMATCSHCHKVTMFEKWGEYIRPYNFCPNCGARMKGCDSE